MMMNLKIFLKKWFIVDGDKILVVLNFVILIGLFRVGMILICKLLSE